MPTQAPRHLWFVPPVIRTPEDAAKAIREFATWMQFKLFELDTQNDLFYQGTGTPEGVVDAKIGSIYQRTDGGAGTTIYVKESGTGKNGWIGK